MSEKRRRMKFRLVDLMMTMAVLAILFALASYGFRYARQHARRNQCQTNLRQIGLCVYSMGASPVGYPHASTAADRQGQEESGRDQRHREGQAL